MAETRWIPTQRSGRASMLGASFGSGVGQGLEAIVSQMAQNKAEKIRAGHLKSLMPGASDEQVGALSHLGSSVYEPALRGGFGQQEQIEKINPANPVSGSRGSGDFQAGPFFEMLSGMGLKMSPEQQKQLGSLPPERQEQIARQVFEKLSPQQQDRLEDAIKQRTALSQEQIPQQAMQQQPQQVIGSQEPGIAPQQPLQPQKQPISLSQALSNDQIKSESPAEIKRQQDLNIKIEATNEIDDALKDIEDILSSGDIQTGFIAQKAAEAGFLSQLTPETAQLYQAMQDLLVKQQVAASLGGRGSNEFRKTIASAKLNLAQPLPVIKKTLEKLKKANMKHRESLQTIRAGGQIEERPKQSQESLEKPSQVVKSLDQAKVKEGARAKNLDTDEFFIFRNGKWEEE